MTVDETPNSTAKRLEVALDIDASPDVVWRCFTEADGLTGWWADEASVDARVGGDIVARWPAMEWTMRGRFTELEQPTRLAFTWAWDHEPDTPERLVMVHLTAGASGTDLVLSHGDYGPDDGDERQSHLDGWRHFLPSLAAAATA